MPSAPHTTGDFCVTGRPVELRHSAPSQTFHSLVASNGPVCSRAGGRVEGYAHARLRVSPGCLTPVLTTSVARKARANECKRCDRHREDRLRHSPQPTADKRLASYTKAVTAPTPHRGNAGRVRVQGVTSTVGELRRRPIIAQQDLPRPCKCPDDDNESIATTASHMTPGPRSRSTVTSPSGSTRVGSPLEGLSPVTYYRSVRLATPTVASPRGPRSEPQSATGDRDNRLPAWYGHLHSVEHKSDSRSDKEVSQQPSLSWHANSDQWHVDVTLHVAQNVDESPDGHAVSSCCHDVQAPLSSAVPPCNRASDCSVADVLSKCRGEECRGESGPSQWFLDVFRAQRTDHVESLARVAESDGNACQSLSQRGSLTVPSSSASVASSGGSPLDVFTPDAPLHFRPWLKPRVSAPSRPECVRVDPTWDAPDWP